MNKILILADDLTGANDTGATIAQLGWETCSIVNADIKPEDADNYDCVSVNLDSRSMESRMAYETVQEAVKRFAGKNTELYSKRIDSTLRGNLGWECDGLLDVLSEGNGSNGTGDWAAMIVPAFPQAGRTYENDTLYVNGVPLAQTAAAKDPKCPVHTSSALELFRQQSKYKTDVVKLEYVRQEQEVLESEIKKLLDSGTRNLLFEAVTISDIERIAKALTECPVPFVAADPGTFTAALTTVMFGKGRGKQKQESEKFAGERVLAVIGSVNQVARTQTQKLLERPDVGYAVLDVEKLLENQMSCGEQIREAVEKLQKIKEEKPVSVLLLSSSIERERVSLKRFEERDKVEIDVLCKKMNQAIAYAAARLVEEGGYGGLFTTGGDITVAVCKELDAGGVRIKDEILPLAVGGQIRLSDGKVLCLATKGGMIGNEEATCECMDYLIKNLKSYKQESRRLIMERPVIAIPMGDPAGVGPEIVIKSMMNEEVIEKARCVAVGDKRILERALTFPGIPKVEIKVIEKQEDGDYRKGVLNVVDLNNLAPEEYEMGKVNAKCGKACYEYIAKAIDMAMKGEADAVSTTPINKESLRAADIPYIGHTEIFGALTGTEDPLTIFEVRNMRVFFLTRHMSLRNACDKITKERIIDYVKRSQEVLKQLGVEDGVMAIAGLNPHSGEHGLFGDEEVKEVYPAIDELKAMGYPVEGPIGADSVFHLALQGRYNSVLSLYHDQGHIATKTLDFYRTISITGGMPILRTSVDHGTAFDVAGKGVVSSVSMEEAILIGAQYAPAFSKNIKESK